MFDILHSDCTLICSDEIIDLRDEAGATVVAGIKVELHLISEPAKDFMLGVDANVARLNGTGMADAASTNIDSATSWLHSGSGAAQTIGTCIAPLGQVLQLFVKLMDSIADVWFPGIFGALIH